MKKHKIAMFVENLLLILIFITIIYFTYNPVVSFFKNKQFKIPTLDFNLSTLNIDTDIFIKKYNKNILTKENNIGIIDKNGSLDINKTIKDNNISIIDKNGSLDINKTIKDSNISTKTYSKKKILKTLHIYINNLRKDINYNAVVIDNIKNNEIKVRVTMLKNGNYQRLTFIDGNKNLLEYAKNTINKSLPKKPSEIILNEFPRYVKIDIKFRQINGE